MLLSTIVSDELFTKEMKLVARVGALSNGCFKHQNRNSDKVAE
jgi:hypothetical protein